MGEQSLEPSEAPSPTFEWREEAIGHSTHRPGSVRLFFEPSPALLQMAAQITLLLLRPGFRLEARRQLADIVEKGEGREPLNFSVGEPAFGGACQTVGNDGKTDELLDDGCDIHRMVDQMVRWPSLPIRFSPCATDSNTPFSKST